MTDVEPVSPPDPARPSKGIAISNWLLAKTTGLLERKASRRGFLVGTAMAGSAVAVAGCQFATQPGTAYNRITDCSGGLCRDGYTEFCCAINNGLNTCPPGSFAGGWWRADHSSFCEGGTRYYIDCMQNCCGPPVGGQAPFGQQFSAGCTECRCAAGCDTRRVYCNYFRYGQCHMEITQSGPIACRVVSCVPPWSVAEYACNPNIPAVDNTTAEHAGNCSQNLDPATTAPLMPAVGSAVVAPPGSIKILVRGTDSAAWLNTFAFGQWSGWATLGGFLTSDPILVADPTAAGSMYALVRGNDFSVWANRFNGGGWSSWFRIQGLARSDPYAVGTGPGARVFIRGADLAIHTSTLAGLSATGWQSLGGTITSDPIPITGVHGTIVFGRGTDNAMWYCQDLGAGFSPWAQLGGGFTSNPAAVMTGSAAVVAGRGTDDRLWASVFNGGSWSLWDPVGGPVASDAVLVARSTKFQRCVRVRAGYEPPAPFLAIQRDLVELSQ